MVYWLYLPYTSTIHAAKYTSHVDLDPMGKVKPKPFTFGFEGQTLRLDDAKSRWTSFLRVSSRWLSWEITSGFIQCDNLNASWRMVVFTFIEIYMHVYVIAYIHIYAYTSYIIYVYMFGLFLHIPISYHINSYHNLIWMLPSQHIKQCHGVNLINVIENLDACAEHLTLSSWSLVLFTGK